jgi:hypothetical protein
MLNKVMLLEEIMKANFLISRKTILLVLKIKGGRLLSMIKFTRKLTLKILLYTVKIIILYSFHCIYFLKIQFIYTKDLQHQV